MSELGWIKLHRKLQKKGYYKKSEYIHLWVHLLLSANHKEKEFMFNGNMIIIKEGQLLTGREKLSENTGISESTVERILNMLENEHQIEQQKTNKFRIITIINWQNYQGDNDCGQQNGQQTDNKRTTNGQQTATNKNDNNVKNVKNIYSEQSPEIILSNLLYGLMLKNNPNARQPNFQVWAKQIDKMMRLDKRNVEDIENIIRWSQQDSFWCSNILSTSKLRIKYDQLFLVAKRSKDNGRTKPVITESELRDFSESILNDNRYK
jgi:hypothetical protein